MTRLAERIRSLAPAGVTCLALALLVVAVSAQAPVGSASTDDRFAIPATDEGLPGTGPIRRNEWFQNQWRPVAPPGRRR